MYKTLSHHLQRGEGKVRSLSPETLDYERRKNEKIATIGSVHKGKILRGKVKKILDYGAFVDVGCINGFVHISEVSHKKINIHNEIKLGEFYNFKVIEVGLDKKGVLSLKLTMLLGKRLTDEIISKNASQKAFSNNAFGALSKLQISK